MAYNNRRGSGMGGGYGSPHGMNLRRGTAGMGGGNYKSQFVSGGQLNPQGNSQHHSQQARYASNQGNQQNQQRPNNPPSQQVRQEKLQSALKQQAQEIITQQSVPKSQPNNDNKIPPPFIAEVENAKSTKPEIAKPAKPETPVATSDFDITGDETKSSENDNNNQSVSKKPRPAWVKKDGKVNKHERLRRRNQRLRKILQPKNALMVLNELIGVTTSTITESNDFYGTAFNCTILVDGVEHKGIGKSKPAAKSSAAEAALKYMVLNNMMSSPLPQNISACANTSTESSGQDGSENVELQDDSTVTKMEVDDDSSKNISWSHIACYALHKLLSSWDEGNKLLDKVTQASQVPAGGAVSVAEPPVVDKKPAKKLPENASTMNPIMLLNQMQPGAQYTEISKVGNPPNISFTLKCNIEGETFYGTASTKKGAKKICAFGACRKILGINYSPEFLEENNFVESATQVGSSA